MVAPLPRGFHIVPIRTKLYTVYEFENGTGFEEFITKSGHWGPTVIFPSTPGPGILIPFLHKLECWGNTLKTISGLGSSAKAPQANTILKGGAIAIAAGAAGKWGTKAGAAGLVIAAGVVDYVAISSCAHAQ